MVEYVINQYEAGEAEELGYAVYNNVPHLVIDVLEDTTISVVLPNGTKASFFINVDNDHGCIDAQVIKPGVVHKMSDGRVMPHHISMGLMNGHDQFRTETGVTILMTGDDYYLPNGWVKPTWGIPTTDRNTVAWWGARAILKDGEIDVLPDRRSVWGNGETEVSKGFSDLVHWIDKKGLKLVEKLDLNPREGKLHYIEDGKFRGLADTRGSCGYVYLGFWKVK